jgi:hypothetical protein
MQTEAKTLLVIYKEKDEVVLNQLKKLVALKDDKEEQVIGTEDGTVNIVAWNEKLYIENKKSGNVENVSDKILFIGDIKGTEMLSPVLDEKFNARAGLSPQRR